MEGKNHTQNHNPNLLSSPTPSDWEMSDRKVGDVKANKTAQKLTTTCATFREGFPVAS